MEPMMEALLKAIPTRTDDPEKFFAAFCVDAEVRPSSLHGEGVHLRRPVRRGTVICNVFRTPDTFLATERDILRLWRQNPRAAVLVVGRVHGDYFAYGHHQDAECYLNHSDRPNALNYLGQTIALRDIAAGEEVTIDYRYIFAEQMFITTDKGEIRGYNAQEATERATRLFAELLGVA